METSCFLDAELYYEPSVFAVSDAKHDNSAELWHCKMGHVNYPGMKRLQRLATCIHIAAKTQAFFL